MVGKRQSLFDNMLGKEIASFCAEQKKLEVRRVKQKTALFIVAFVAVICVLVLVPPAAEAKTLEAVYVAKVFSSDYKVIIVRGNGDVYLVKYGVGVPSLWLYENKAVYIYSPYSFAGVSSRIILPDRGQDARIWNAEYLGNIYWRYRILR